MRHAKRLLILTLLTTVLHAQELTNAKVVRHAAPNGVSAAVASIDTSNAAWIAWTVPAGDGITICCGGWKKDAPNCCGTCSLSKSQGFNMGDARFRGSDRIVVAARFSEGVLQRIRLFDAACPVDGEGSTVHVLEDVDAESSVAWLVAQAAEARDENSVVAALAQHDSPAMLPALEKLAGDAYRNDVREQAIFWLGQRGGERGAQLLRDMIRGAAPTSLQKKAVFSLSQSEAEGTTDELITIARQHINSSIRREAIFWLGQKAGAKAAGELRRAVDEDPEEDVREHAVFAISQLPRDRSVPLLVDLARNHKSRRVREKAIFWLTQSGDSRALDLIEEILEK